MCSTGPGGLIDARLLVRATTDVPCERRAPVTTYLGHSTYRPWIVSLGTFEPWEGFNRQPRRNQLAG